jgi:inhibitor of cysteine peptidase
MSSKTLTLLLFTGILVFSAACGAANQVTLTAADKDSQVDIAKGGTIVITLEGNPSTGFSWEARDLNTAMFEQVGEPVFTSSNPDLIGSGGTVTLTFKTLQAGAAALNLVYHRSWETGVDPLDTFSVSVRVK